MKTFLTFNELSRRTGIPAGSLFNRIREMNILPDGISLRVHGPPIQLFDADRLPALRLQLQNQIPS